MSDDLPQGADGPDKSHWATLANSCKNEKSLFSHFTFSSAYFTFSRAYCIAFLYADDKETS